MSIMSTFTQTYLVTSNVGNSTGHLHIYKGFYVLTSRPNQIPICIIIAFSKQFQDFSRVLRCLCRRIFCQTKE